MRNTNSNYILLPFRFDRFNGEILVVNEVGQYYILPFNKFKSFIEGKLSKTSVHYKNLKSMQFISDKICLPDQINIIATAYRTKKRFLFEFTTLHMIVLTRRCNQQCSYCHVSSLPEYSGSNFDMSISEIHSCIDIILKSPSKDIKIEIQGGEPLLRFDLIKELVRYAKEQNDKLNIKKSIEFVVCTNLIALNQYMLDFFKNEKIQISTSLDGPKDIHDSCRKLVNGKGSYDIVKDKLKWAINYLSKGSVGALMTITPYNINRLKEVVDEYISIGLDSIFLRPINPFGRATNPEFFNAYTTEDFLNQYKAILEYIIEVNKYRHFPEIYTTILLTKIITPFSTGFVDLQSPAGVGISGVIYDVSGDVFVSDEARMMNYVYGEKKFCIGNVNMGSFKSIFCNDKLKKIISESCSESLAPCAWCAYLPYCGLDPVRNFIKYDTISPYMGKTEDCIRHKEMFKHLITLIESGDNDKINILWSWITSRSVKEIAPSINIEEYL